MTTHDQRLARALKQAMAEKNDTPDSPEARARTVAALQAAMQQAPPAASRPGSRNGWRFGLAAGMALLLGAGFWFQSQPRTVARVVASTGALAVGHLLTDTELVSSGMGPMTLELLNGVRVQLEPQTAVQLRDDGARLVIWRGAVAAEIVSSPFALEAGDTLVASRGARVSVKPGAGCDGRAQVEVSEGSVMINGGTSVRAGEGWPRCPPPAALPAPSLDAPAAPAPPAAIRAKRPPPVPKEKADDQLARHNELYLQALSLKRAGDVSAAVKKLDAVLAEGRSPLEETALAQKMKWLSATDRPAARAVAQSYLERFPMGFGRADAETLVLETP